MAKLRPKDGKKYKGKKKVANVLEKKAKGLKLNQVDRKRVVKVEQRMAQKQKIHNAVKDELHRLDTMNVDDDDTRDSLFSESSFGSQPAPKTPKEKRVSFAGNLEATKVFDKNDKSLVIKPSEASPGKGILRAKEKKEKKGAKKVETKVVENKAENGTEKKENDNAEVFPSRKKMKLQVTKKVKEQLLAMPRKERKAFLKELKAQKNPLSDVVAECKQLWEKIRSSKTPKLEKDDCVSKLVGLVKGNAAKLIYPHDTCRVFECLLALKRPGITSMLFDELTPELVKMTKSKYAHFFVNRMLKLGTKEQRNTIINSFHGHCVALMRIAHAAEVLETAYNEFSNAKQRFDIVSEFYGREFVLFRSDTVRPLAQIIAEEPAKKKLILQHLEELLQVWVEKTTCRLSLTHKLLLDFLTHCDSDQLSNMIDSLKDKIPELVHTSDGSQVAMKIIWNSQVKDRKLIVKNFKDLSVKAAMEHYGHRVLEAIFDSVDDTVLVNKFIVMELSHDIKKLVEDPWGEKVLHYLVHPRDGRGMLKQAIQKLQEGDSNPHSKKNKKDRYAELYKGICESLYTYLAANMEELIFDLNKPNFVIACLESTSQYDLFERCVPKELRKGCYDAVVAIAQQEFIPMDSERLHLIEQHSGYFVLKELLKCDAQLPEEERLSVALATTLTNEQLGSWITCNRGCHTLANMWNVGGEAVQKKIVDSINHKQLAEYTCKGAILLNGLIKGKI